MVLPRDAEQLDPRFVADPYGLKVSRLLYASLVTIDPQTLEAIPDLAERIDIESEARYRVVLRSGLRFSDGTALDAEDVVATFEGVVDPAVGSRYASTYRRIARIAAEDARTILFELDAPHATFMTDLELPVMRAEDAHRPLGAAAGPIGAGPYRLQAHGNARLELTANPHWHRGRAAREHIRMIAVRDDNTRALRLLAGSGDLAVNAVPPLLLPLFDEGSGFEVRTAPGIGTSYVGMNLGAEKLRDVRVRRAIALAIDRETLIETELGGRATLATSFVPTSHWALDASLEPVAFDPREAERLLDAAGLRDPDGEGPEPRLALTLRTSTDRFRLSVSRAIAAMLRDVGIEVEVRPSEAATVVADLDRGRFELTFMQIPEVIEPHVLSWFFASDHIPGVGREGGANRWRLRSRALDAALERGRATSDRTARIAAYHDAQRILADELPVVPLFHEDVVAVVGPRARTYEVPRDGRFGTLAEVE